MITCMSFIFQEIKDKITMKYKFLTFLAFVLSTPLAFSGNYVLTINDKEYDLSLGEKERIKVGDQYLSIILNQKDNLIFKTDNFSFQHPSKYSPSKNDLGNGIYQSAMMTPLGTVVLVQEYSSIDPSGLVDLMVNEVTKEERNYGYDIKSSPDSLTLSDGAKLTGKVVVSKYKGSNIKRNIYTYGMKDSGLLIMTQIDYGLASSDEEIIKNFFDSLLITIK